MKYGKELKCPNNKGNRSIYQMRLTKLTAYHVYYYWLFFNF